MIPSGMDIVLCVSESEQPEVFELDALPSWPENAAPPAREDASVYLDQLGCLQFDVRMGHHAANPVNAAA
eukprot:g6738.t1